MDDYSALAQRVAVSVGDVRGLLILSREGLVLGAYPEDDEAVAKPAWLKFATLGEPAKSFVEFPTEIWVFAHRGPYSTFAVADTKVKPGVLLDLMEQALLTAEEARTRRDGLKLPEAVSAPSGKPRAPLHPQSPKQTPERVAAEVEAGTQHAVRTAGEGAAPQTDGSAEPVRKPDPPRLVKPTPSAESDGDFVDAVELQKEFGGLLQTDSDDDEASS
jgi:hypothetical protein